MGALWRYRPCPRAASIEIGRLEAACPLSLTAHFHPDVQIAAVAHGWRCYATPLAQVRAAAGDIVVIPARMPHASHGSATSIVTHLYVPDDHPAVQGVAFPQIIQGSRAKSSAEVLDAVGSMWRRPRRADMAPSALAMTPYVLRQDLDVGSVAALAGYSTDGFIRAFRRQYGMTPAAYRVAHRLANARSWLKRGDAVADAAYAASFADQSHLGRLFRRAYGATPGAYRAAFARGSAVDFVPDGRPAPE